MVGVVGDGAAVEVEGFRACVGMGFGAVDAGEVLAGGAELAVELGGEFEVDELGGSEAEELGEAALDGVEVEGFRKYGAGGVAVENLGFEGAAGAVVVEAELFAAEGGGAALVAIGEEVAARAEGPGEGMGGLSFEG